MLAAAYYAPRGIRINVIAPGLVATPMSGRAQANAEIMRVRRRASSHSPAASCTPDDLVGTALYLLSDDALMVTGQVIDVDAGWSLS